MCVVLDPKQRLAMFRKLEEMTRVRPVALHPKHRPPRLDYVKSKMQSVVCADNKDSDFSDIFLYYQLSNLLCNLRT